jgi:hypothetical protein
MGSYAGNCAGTMPRHAVLPSNSQRIQYSVDKSFNEPVFARLVAEVRRLTPPQWVAVA